MKARPHSSPVSRRSVLRRSATAAGATLAAGLSVSGDGGATGRDGGATGRDAGATGRDAGASNTDPDAGRLFWRERFATRGLDRFDDAVRTADGRFVAVGTVTRGDGETAGFLVEVTEAGVVRRTRQFEDGDESRLYSIEPTSDGGYLLCGRATVRADDGTTEDRGLLCKLSATFEREFTITDESFQYQFPMAIQLADGTLVATSTRFALGHTTVTVVGIDPESETVAWEWELNRSVPALAYDLMVLGEHAVVLLSREEREEQTAVLSVVDASGNVRRRRQIPVAGGVLQFDATTVDDRVVLADVTRDGEAILRVFDAELQPVASTTVPLPVDVGLSIAVATAGTGRYLLASTPRCAWGGSPVLAFVDTENERVTGVTFELSGHCVDDLVPLADGRALLFGRTDSATVPSDGWLALVGSKIERLRSRFPGTPTPNQLPTTEGLYERVETPSMDADSGTARISPTPPANTSSENSTAVPGFGLAAGAVSVGTVLLARWLQSRDES